MSGWFGTKKRKANEEETVLHSGKNQDASSVNEELIAIKSSMHEMMNQNRAQMDSMLQLMTSMQGEMKNMRNDINILSNKCDRMEQCRRVDGQFQANMEKQIGDLNVRFGQHDDKLSYHYILLKNQKWEYSAINPPEDYWDDTPIMHDDAESFLKQIRRKTEQIRYGQLTNGKIDLNEVEGDTAFLPYDDAFLPHWKEFITAIQQYQYYYKYHLKVITNNDDEEEEDTVLELNNLEMPGEVLDLLSEALETTYFNCLSLAWNNFGQKGIEFALDYLRRNSKCKHLCLNCNDMSMLDIDLLSTIVDTHPSIEKLELSGCKGDRVDGYDMLQRIMRAGKSKLKFLDMSNNDISTGGDTFISEFLAGNPILESLHLRHNQFDDNDAIMIASALKHNTNLKMISLKFNQKITSAGWGALSKAVFDERSLNSANDSNHSCRISFPRNEGVGVQDINGDPNSTDWIHPLNVRQKKIYLVLLSRNGTMSNVENFDEDLSSELLPDMLSSIQTYSDYYFADNSRRDVQNPLSITYEILKHWDKALAVFEALGS